MELPARLKKRIQVGGVHANSMSLDELRQTLDVLAQDRSKTDYVCFCEAHLCVQGSKRGDVGKAIERATLVLPDGVSMTAGGRLLGHRFVERLPGPLVMLDYCRHSAVPGGLRHFFYGGAPGVADKLCRNLLGLFPHLNIVGTYCPPFRELTRAEEVAAQKRIEDSGTDVLWVALGAPKQELWMHAQRDKIQVPLMMGVGAAFDFHSGNRKWAPHWVRRIGAEWIYRMITGGRRVFIRNLTFESRFVFLVLRQLISSRIRGAN